tara:strand:+ start:462 stop:884 length:423 start_codon:yes stop_codon:yes gene_type:complete
MPIGTKIVASRAGIVIATEEQYTDDDHTPFHENFVLIEHDDGTFARYFHLTQNGALVEVGDSVSQLEVIALSGNSGKSSAGPHLHFDVFKEVHNGKDFCDRQHETTLDFRLCSSLPLSFLNSELTDCGLRFGILYEAFSF